MTNPKSIMKIMVLIITISLTVSTAIIAQDKNDSKSATATSANPSGFETVKVGPLEITPSKANVLLVQDNQYTKLYPTLRFKIANTSASDVKIIMFAHSINAIDNLGEQLFNDINSAGIILSNKYANQFNTAPQDEKGMFVTLAPKQLFEAQLMANNGRFIHDKDKEFFRAHRPKTIDFSGTIGVINIDNSFELRAFSFSELPVVITTR